MTPRPVALLVNPSAGGGRALKALPSVEAELARLGVPFRVARTESIRHAIELASGAADAGEVATPLSGDGLVGAVATALRGREDAVMGILPGGRGNDFARAMGIGTDPIEACALLAAGVPTPIDVGEVVSEGTNQPARTFVGIASVGFDSVANKIANEAPSALGPMVYAYAALRAMGTFRPVTFDVTVGRERRTFQGWSVAAANGKAYGGGMYAAPEARLDDGEIDAIMFSPRSRLDFVSCLRDVFKGTHLRREAIAMLRGPEVRIAADRPFTVYADGDPIGELPVTVRAVPGAIRVLLPA
ncbi:MAG TPA: diacylglycerol kinase family protein [Baekduia sp.]|uniref:diacylglycerol/lipid kinase family protein n=1 Tax=Baekduia sp. TaxID=2600305 RepID=UPI002D77114B|nr:diacylglycerol kinase family protein [Baekduia sp.]HET6509290.1 diacylglycerol kinase family protein [Baekduia sp.]